MYSYIRGELADINFDHIVIDVNGIGYQIYIPGQSMNYLPSVGEELKVHTYLYIREDMMVLYGFLTKDDLEIFKQLITVNGIGPKGGLAILSTLSAEDLRFAIISGDSKAIAKAPGIGAKTAQRVILDLKDKVSIEDTIDSKLTKGVDNAMAATNNSNKNDAVLALNALGYSSTESLKAVSRVDITPDMDVEDILKAALKFMSII